jgi:hypothetical protein
MGWTHACDPAFKKEDLLKELRDPDRFKDWKITISRVVGSNHWYLMECDGTRMIGLDLMRSGGRTEGWGHKSMTEADEPYYYNCPLSLLKAASTPVNSNSVRWREEVRKRADKPCWTVGQAVRYGSTDYTLEAPLGRKGWRVSRVPDHEAFRLTCRQMAHAKPVEAVA